MARGDGRQALGQRGEELAASYLEGKGHEILNRNWRCEHGELDLVTQDHCDVVFVEVRTRRGTSMGSPEESITPVKQSRLISLAEAYVQEHDWMADWRIDVVAIEVDHLGRLVRIDHYENAITG